MSLSTTRNPSWLPRLGAAAAALVGLINIASALTPNIRWRGHLLLDFEPVAAMRLFHALALPTGAALLLVAPYLLKRRRRACQVAIVLMLALGAFDLLKGLDFGEMIVTWSTAAALWCKRDAFRVIHDPITLRSAAWRVPLLGGTAVTVTAIAAWASNGRPSPAAVARETLDLLRWRTGPIDFHRHHLALLHHFAWVPLSVHLIEIATLISVAYVIFRPLAASRALPGPAARAAAAALCAHTARTRSRSSSSAPTSIISSATTDRRSWVTESRTASSCCPAIRSARRKHFPGC